MKFFSGGADMLSATVVATQCLVHLVYLRFHRKEAMQTQEVHA